MKTPIKHISVSRPGKSLAVSIYPIPGNRLIFLIHEQPKALRANWGLPR